MPLEGQRGAPDRPAARGGRKPGRGGGGLEWPGLPSGARCQAGGPCRGGGEGRVSLRERSGLLEIEAPAGQGLSGTVL